ncbi:hypothetical protein [Nostoc sp. PCC 7524]|uniref:hypothetical protein n=1 Tax=Nostoc sp. (strain ATCC 29411 / PCC 7524) TaxID=28072 RepID=UPI0014949498|nr:hypothetical protein [Nostoc sp. PCC 7524]
MKNWQSDRKLKLLRLEASGYLIFTNATHASVAPSHLNHWINRHSGTRPVAD